MTDQSAGFARQTHPTGSAHSGDLATGTLFKPAAEDDQLHLELDNWQGPLDVLLDLARRQKVDLRNISILSLTDQYLQFIEGEGQLRLDLAADYLVMAAWLAYLKSALLLPREEQDELDADELAAQLQWRLRRLDAMRDVAAKLLARDQAGRDIFVRGAPEGLRVLKHHAWRCDWYDLMRAYGDVRRRREPVFHLVRERPVVSLEAALERLCAMLGVNPGWRALRDFLPPRLGSQMRRSALAASFVAALELARQGRARLRQDETFGPLFVRGTGRSE